MQYYSCEAVSKAIDTIRDDENTKKYFTEEQIDIMMRFADELLCELNESIVEMPEIALKQVEGYIDNLRQFIYDNPEQYKLDEMSACLAVREILEADVEAL